MGRGLDRRSDDGTPRPGGPTEVLPVRTRDLRPGQARAAMGPRDLGRAPGTGMSLLSGGAAGLGGSARSVRELWGHEADRDARAGRVLGVRPCSWRAGRARVVEGRLAQR